MIKNTKPKNIYVLNSSEFTFSKLLKYMVNNPNITVSKWNDSTSYLITPQTITLIIHTENVSPATQVKMNGYL